jgi:hypothetical protein
MATWFLKKLDTLTRLVVAIVMTTCQFLDQENDQQTTTARYLARPSQMLMKVWMNCPLKNPPTADNRVFLFICQGVLTWRSGTNAASPRPQCQLQPRDSP